MKVSPIVLVCLVPLLLLVATTAAVAVGGGGIHPFAYGTTTSYTSPDGEKVGCMTSGTSYTLKIDFYYHGNTDNDLQITSLTLQIWDGTGLKTSDSSWNPVSFTVTWEYSIDGESTWNPYSGTGNIDVPWSGKTGVGNLETSDPHATVKLTFVPTGSIGDLFYYRVHFTSTGNNGNHHFYYDICNGTVIPEFSEVSIAALMAILVTFVYLRRHK